MLKLDLRNVTSLRTCSGVDELPMPWVWFDVVLYTPERSRIILIRLFEFTLGDSSKNGSPLRPNSKKYTETLQTKVNARLHFFVNPKYTQNFGGMSNVYNTHSTTLLAWIALAQRVGGIEYVLKYVPKKFQASRIKTVLHLIGDSTVDPG